jgi:hypothetical protein
VQATLADPKVCGGASNGFACPLELVVERESIEIE